MRFTPLSKRFFQLLPIFVLIISCTHDPSKTTAPLPQHLDSISQTNHHEIKDVTKKMSAPAWLNNGIKIYTDTVSEIWYTDTLTSSNFLKYLHPWEAEEPNKWMSKSGPIYYRGFYDALDTVTLFTSLNVTEYCLKIDSAYDYYMKNYLERGDLDAGIANRISITIIKTYLFAQIKNWDEAAQQLIAESKLKSSYHINLHTIAIPILYEKYGPDQILKNTLEIDAIENQYYFEGILFDLDVIRARFRDKTMTWESYFKMAFARYEKHGL